MPSLHAFQPGQRVRVIQQIPFGARPESIATEGTVIRFGQQKTGSWFAHTKDHKVWIDRLELRRDDGEVVVLNLDQYSHIDLLN